MYVLPGALLTGGGRACCMSESGFVDVGVEVSAHRFVRGSGSTIFTQLGYGGLVQLQVGGIPMAEKTPSDLGPHLRLGLGGQGTWGLLGLQGGIMTRAGSATYGTTAGVFGGAFVTFGLVSGGLQVDVPIASSTREPRMPTLAMGMATVKWVLPWEVEK